MNRRLVFLFLFAAVLNFAAELSATTAQQQEVLLRDLTRMDGTSVVRFDRFSVELSNGKTLSWDQILQASGGNAQQDFDQRLRSFGLPLFRVRQRLANQDYDGAGVVADRLLTAMLPELRSVAITSSASVNSNGGLSLAQQASIARTTSETIYTICVLAMHARLNSGHRESALTAFLVAADYHQTVDDAIKEALGPAKLTLDTGAAPLNYFHEAIQPVWFHNQARQTALAEIRAYFVDPSAGEQTLPPGVELYLASLEASVLPMGGKNAGKLNEQIDIASKLLQAEIRIRDDRSAGSELLRRAIGNVQFALKQDDIAASQAADPSEHPMKTLMRHRFLKRRFLESDEAQDVSRVEDSNAVDAILDLLSIAANHRPKYPRLAAAALEIVAQYSRAIGDEETTKKLEYELSSYKHSRRP